MEVRACKSRGWTTPPSPPPTSTAADFTAALHAVLHDRRLRAGAAALADALDADGGVDLAVRLIVERAQGGGSGTGGVPSSAAPSRGGGGAAGGGVLSTSELVEIARGGDHRLLGHVGERPGEDDGDHDQDRK